VQICGTRKRVSVAKSVTIVIPAYCEAEAIGETLAELQAVVAKCGIEADIIVVDDGSTDETAGIASAANVRVIRHKRQRGYGAALKTGILAAETDTVAITDADGTYPLESLPSMLDELQTADMVVGSRTGKNVRIPLVRRPAKWFLNQFANYVCGKRIPDLNSGFRVFPRDLVLEYFHILPDGFSWTTTITLALICDNYAIGYHTIDYRHRKGQSKIVPWDAMNFAMLIVRMAILFRPLRVMLPPAFLCFLYASVKTVIDLAIVGDPMVSASAVLMMNTAVNIAFMGMLAEAIATHVGRRRPGSLVISGERDLANLNEERQPEFPPK
jgi:glycosyltransferase involved in cell wall biosynthesis